MTSEPFAALGAYLTAFEAGRIAAALEAGDTTSRALNEVNANRRSEARRLLVDAGLGQADVVMSVAVLRAIAGARAVRTSTMPVWTMPGSEAISGRLTSSAQRLVQEARMSVVCSSYNFNSSSYMRVALKEASERAGVAVTIYLDTAKGTPDGVAADIPRATVYRTLTLSGSAKPLVSHAKFIIVDRAVVLLTSANFSYSAENSNVELGLLVNDTALAASIESTMRSKHGILYGRVECP